MRRLTVDAVRRAIPERVAPWAEALSAAGDELGIGIHLVGGPVRDFLLGREVRDVDLIAEPREGSGGAADVARRAALAGVRCTEHPRFGTLRFEAGGESLDLATVRSESYAQPGALPTVAVGTLMEDLHRRDFTVNAMAVPLNRVARRGRPALIDPGSSLADLEAGVLRVFHARSFHDDPTRALRAARLAPRLGFRLARVTRSALRAALRDGAFGAVRGERFRAEIEKLFDDPRQGLDPARAVGMLQAEHVLGALEPGLHLPPSCRAPLRRLGRDLVELQQHLPVRAPWIAGLRVWVGALEADLRRRVLRRLAVRGAAALAVGRHRRESRQLLARLAAARGRGATDAVVRDLPPETLLALAAEATPPVRRRLLRWVREDRAKKPPVDGRDLLALGLSGPAVGRALARIRVAWLDAAIRSREDALALAKELARGGRGRRSA